MNSRLAHRIQPRRSGAAVSAGRSTLTLAARSARASRRAIRASAQPGGSEPGTGAPAGDAHTGASATADTMPKHPYSTLYYRASDIYRVHHLSPNSAHDSDREDTAAELHSADNSFVRASVRGSRESGSAFQSSGAGRATGQVAARRGAGENFLAECVCISQGYLSTRPQNRAVRNRNCGRGIVSR